MRENCKQGFPYTKSGTIARILLHSWSKHLFMTKLSLLIHEMRLEYQNYNVNVSFKKEHIVISF